jgi:hypothetical protein
MSTEVYEIIGIEMVLLAFSIAGVFSLPFRSKSKKTVILMKTGFSLLLISFWASLLWSDIFWNYDYYLIGLLVVHVLFLLLSVHTIFSTTKNIAKKWIKYATRLIGIAFISYMEFIMAVVVLVGY